MICTRQPSFLKDKPIKISNIWEVRLDSNVWNKIILTMKFRKVSASWIVRFCTFRLCENIATNKLSSPEEKKYRCADIKTAHRHRLCLYGHDEKYLRIIAIENNLTVSAFIRYALLMYLDDLMTTKVTDQELFQFGIKINRTGDCTRKNSFRYPLNLFYEYKRFLPSEWWIRSALNHNLSFTKHFLLI